MPGYLPQLLDGALLTVRISVLAALTAIMLAIIAGVGMLSTRRWARAAARAYTELFRGMPTLVLLFWFVFSLPFLGVRIAPELAAVIALALSIGAYEAEVVRGAIQAIPHGQTEAAIALNLSPWTRMRNVILPQAVVIMIPSLAGFSVQLLKSSALVALVGLEDLTFAGDVANNTRNDPLEIFSLVLLGYYVISLVITRSSRRLERRLSSWRPDVPGTRKRKERRGVGLGTRQV